MRLRQRKKESHTGQRIPPLYLFRYRPLRILIIQQVRLPARDSSEHSLHYSLRGLHALNAIFHTFNYAYLNLWWQRLPPYTHTRYFVSIYTYSHGIE